MNVTQPAAFQHFLLATLKSDSIIEISVTVTRGRGAIWGGGEAFQVEFYLLKPF